MQMPVTFKISIRLGTGLNEREHWRTRALRVRRERIAAARSIPHGLPTIDRHQAPFVVELTRVSPKLADLDNVAGGLKAVRDEIARALGVDDGDRKRVRWLYRQAQGSFGVLVAIYERSRVQTRIVPAHDDDQKGRHANRLPQGRVERRCSGTPPHCGPKVTPAGSRGASPGG